MAVTPVPDVRATYDALAPHYDTYAGDYAHDRWLSAIVALARRHGSDGRRALDVACGTGRSTLPLSRMGFHVEACDLSPGMLVHARRRLAGRGQRVFRADMRELPAIGPFDLVTCLNDAVDYLVNDDELLRAMASFARVLAADGVLVFDVNSLGAYRSAFARPFMEEAEGRVFCGRGDATPDAAAGDVFELEIDVFSPTPAGLWRRTVTRHRQRHQTRERLDAAAAGAGLRVVAAHGQRTGVRIEPDVDESRDTKVLYALRHDDRRGGPEHAAPEAVGEATGRSGPPP